MKIITTIMFLMMVLFQNVYADLANIPPDLFAKIQQNQITHDSITDEQMKYVCLGFTDGVISAICAMELISGDDFSTEARIYIVKTILEIQEFKFTLDDIEEGSKQLDEMRKLQIQY